MCCSRARGPRPSRRREASRPWLTIPPGSGRPIAIPKRRATRSPTGRSVAWTGGVFGKLPGRVGDSPIPGAGAWADDLVAVSSTGQGEFFIRTAAAVQVAHRMRWAGQDVEAACAATLADLGSIGGDGGLIAIDRDGRVAMPFNSQGMKRAALLQDGSIVAEAF